MSLRGFHLFFISAAIILSALLSIWCFGVSDEPSGTTFKFIGIASALAGVSLSLYLPWFLRKARALHLGEVETE